MSRKFNRPAENEGDKAIKASEAVKRAFDESIW